MGYNCFRLLALEDRLKLTPKMLERADYYPLTRSSGSCEISVRSAVTFLQIKDGLVPTLTAFNFPRAKTLSQAYLKTALPDTIFIPWRFDPRPDRRAAWQLIQAAILSLGLVKKQLHVLG